MDKHTLKRLLADAELPLVDWAVVRRAAFDADWEAALEPVFHRVRKDAPSWFVKPSNLGSSVGISKVKSGKLEDLFAAVKLAFEYDEKVIVEEGIESPREIECAVLGDEDPIASVVGEIEVSHPDGFYSYAAKYIDETGARLRIPADLTEAQARMVQLHAVRTFRALEASGLARVDFLLDPKDGEIYVNEINTMPGFTAISMYPKLWEASGIGGRELVSKLLDLALARWERRRRLKVTA
jgi:D-alanine-D-alanine ligase